MKKVKITILKTTLDKDLAEEYGSPGLTACPIMKKDRFFMPTGNVLKVFATKLGKQFINMSLHLLMVEQQKNFFITATEIGRAHV